MHNVPWIADDSPAICIETKYAHGAFTASEECFLMIYLPTVTPVHISSEKDSLRTLPKVVQQHKTKQLE